jgi:hypothetical protein
LHPRFERGIELVECLLGMLTAGDVAEQPAQADELALRMLR